MSAAQSVVLTDDQRVRVTTWTFPQAGARTGEHRHEFDYVVVPVTGGTFTSTAADGTSQRLVQVAGVPYVRPSGATHDVVSDAPGVTVFVEIELKRVPAGTPSAQA